MMESKPAWHPMQRRTPFFVEWYFATHVLHRTYKEYMDSCNEHERRVNYWGEVMAQSYESYWNTPEKDRRWWPDKAPEKKTLYDAHGNAFD